MKPLGKVTIKWSSDFAYAIGLIATDGSITKDNKIVLLASKDKEQIENFKKCLHIDNPIGRFARGSEKEKKYFRVQFGDVLFIRFLADIGITPFKTKTIHKVDVPRKYFFDFLRGVFDGDGSFYSYWDPRWKSSFMYYFVICSASYKYLEWLREEIRNFFPVKGYLSVMPKKSTFLLRFAKEDSLKIIRKMYHGPTDICLSRKHLKIIKALDIMGERL